MSKLLSGESLKELVREGVIENGDEKNVEGIKYDFRLGDHFLKTKHQGPACISEFSVEAKENYSIEPGETVFVKSYEKLKLPENIKAELSPKRKLAHLGILILGGFCVDPLYEGYLIFGMYNFSNQSFLLSKENKKIIAAQFYELSEDEISDFSRPDSINDFPDDLIATCKGMFPISIQGINNKISDVENNLLALEKAFKERDDWFNEIRENIGELLSATVELRASLETEKSNRESGYSELREVISADREIRKQMEISIEAEKQVRERQEERFEKILSKQQETIDKLSDSTKTERIIRKAALWFIGILIAGAVAVSIANVSNNFSISKNTKISTGDSELQSN